MGVIRLGWVRVLLVAGACGSSISGSARACPALPPGLKASVQPVNLGSPVPANGALLFALDCYHDCTPCTAAEQRLDITVTDANGRALRGEKPEQILLDEDALRQLVLWRPATMPAPGEYEVSVGVRGQDKPQTLPFTLLGAAAAPDLTALLSTAVSSYRVERGLLYGCDQSINDCDRSSVQFGERFAMYPALDVRVRASNDPLSGQLLFHVMHRAADSTLHWGSWQRAGVERIELAEPLSEYCADVEVRSLLGDGDVIRETRCESNADLTPPAESDTDITTGVEACLRPPSGLEPEWCELHASDCARSLIGCADVERWCAAPVQRGSTSQVREGPVKTSIEAAELCDSPADPYDAGVKGCGCRVTPARSQGLGAAALLTLLLALLRRGLLTCALTASCSADLGSYGRNRARPRSVPWRRDRWSTPGCGLRDYAGRSD